MARKACDLPLTMEGVLVDGRSHSHHLARGFLGTLVVGVVLALDVAERALDTKGGGHELHGGNQLVGGNAFELGDVLEDLIRGLDFGLGVRGLGVTALGPYQPASADEYNRRACQPAHPRTSLVLGLYMIRGAQTARGGTGVTRLFNTSV